MRKPYSEMTKEEKEQALSELITFQELKERLKIEHGPYIYILMSEKKLPGWLVDGTWKFHPAEIDEWTEEIGGFDQIAAHIEDWERRKKEAAEASGAPQ